MNPLALLQEMILAARADGDTDTAAWLESLADDPTEVARVTGAADRTESEHAQAFDRVLLEHGFTGTITDSANRQRHYVDGKQVAAPHDNGGDKGGAGARTSPDVPAEGKAALHAGIDRHLPAEVKAKPALVAKVKDLAVTVLAKAAITMTRLTPAANALAAGLGAYFDLPSDMGKLGYNPNNSSGTANPRVADGVQAFTSEHLGVGVSGHIAATIASQVLSRVVVAAKRKITGARTESEQDALMEVAALIAGVFAEVNQSMGLEGAPTAAATASALGKLMGSK